jgi:hypothetical protein
MLAAHVDPAADQDMSHDLKAKHPWVQDVESFQAVKMILSRFQG